MRVPFADVTPVKIPDGLTDEQVLFLGDIFPTGWQAAVQCDIQPDDTVAVWGAGPVGQFAMRSALLLGARQVVAIDNVRERLSMAKAGGAIPINFDDESVLDRLKELTGGKGPEKCIDAVGMEAHATRSLDSMVDRAKQTVMLETDRPHVLREMIYVCRPAGTLSIPGVYGGLIDKVPFGAADEQGPDGPHRPDPREPLDRRPAAADPGRSDRPVVRHHAHGRTGGWSRHVRDVPRQEGRLHQGRPETLRTRMTRTASPASCPAGALRSAAQGLGVFSLALGVAELLAPRALARMTGMPGRETLIRACGLREIVNGIGLLASVDPRPWLWSRVAGDALDLSTLALRPGARPAAAPIRNAAMWMTTAVGVVDMACALLPDRARNDAAGAAINYRDRSGMPRPPDQMRGAASDFEVPRDMRPPEALRAYTTP